jgi:DGQHR domain-containing protein
MNVSLKTIEVNQPLGQFYISKISGVTLYEMAKADIMTIKKTETENDEFYYELYEGIQRRLNENKVQSIEDYLSAYDATFPTSIVLNVDSKHIIQKSDDELILHKSDITFSIIDGQHRLQGFRKHKDSDFEVIVSIFINLNKEQQARIFTTINSEQTKVDPSISFYLEKDDKFYTPRKIVAQIASTFNIDNKSPWNGKIKLLGTKDDYSYDGVISLSAFAKPILGLVFPDNDFFNVRNKLNFLNGQEVTQILKQFDYSKDKWIFWEFYASQNDKAIYKILFNYFNAFKTVFSRDWGNSKSVLTKTTGYNAMMSLFKDLFKIGYENKDFSEEFFISYLKRLKYLDGTINSTNYGASGLKASNDLYVKFKDHIKI